MDAGDHQHRQAGGVAAGSRAAGHIRGAAAGHQPIGRPDFSVAGGSGCGQAGDPLRAGGGEEGGRSRRWPALVAARGDASVPRTWRIFAARVDPKPAEQDAVGKPGARRRLRQPGRQPRPGCSPGWKRVLRRAQAAGGRKGKRPDRPVRRRRAAAGGGCPCRTCPTGRNVGTAGVRGRGGGLPPDRAPARHAYAAHPAPAGRGQLHSGKLEARWPQRACGAGQGGRHRDRASRNAPPAPAARWRGFAYPTAAAATR